MDTFPWERRPFGVRGRAASGDLFGSGHLRDPRAVGELQAPTAAAAAPVTAGAMARLSSDSDDSAVMAQPAPGDEGPAEDRRRPGPPPTPPGGSGLWPIHKGPKRHREWFQELREPPSKSVRGGTNFCGGKRCQFTGQRCFKLAVGGTNFCVAQCGGKRCQFKDESGQPCSAGARSGTNFCVAHGGGKRCQFKDESGQPCSKGAQSGANFCKQTMVQPMAQVLEHL